MNDQTIDIDFIKHCKRLIASAKTGEALNNLSQVLSQSQRDIVILQSRYKRLQDKHRNNLLSEEEFERERTKLDISMLDLLEKLEADLGVIKEKKERKVEITEEKFNQKNKFSHFLKYKYAYSIFGILALVIASFKFGLFDKFLSDVNNGIVNNTLYERADEHFRKKDFAAAADNYKSYLQLFPDDKINDNKKDETYQKSIYALFRCNYILASNPSSKTSKQDLIADYKFIKNEFGTKNLPQSVVEEYEKFIANQ